MKGTRVPARPQNSRPKSVRTPARSTVAKPRDPPDSELGSSRQQFVDSFNEARRNRGAAAPPVLINSRAEDGSTVVLPDPRADPAVFWARMAAAAGSPHPEVQIRRLDELQLALGRSPVALTSALAEIIDLAPRDGAEGMLVTQLVCVHRLAISMLASVRDSGAPLEIATFHYAQLHRLLRLFAAQMDALQRYRGKAPTEQNVSVKHVHVYPGAQAIVGNLKSTHSAERTQ